PYQHFVLTSVPSVFNPHDLQHVHYPQFFSAADVEWREATYGAACRAANTVVAISQWVKDDIVRHYKIQPEKIQVIRWPPPTRAYPDPTEETLNEVKERYGLQISGRFIDWHDSWFFLRCSKEPASRSWKRGMRARR